MTKRISPSDIVLFNMELGVAEQCQLDLPPRRPGRKREGKAALEKTGDHSMAPG
jgi:hypothetical protein